MLVDMANIKYPISEIGINIKRNVMLMLVSSFHRHLNMTVAMIDNIKHVR